MPDRDQEQIKYWKESSSKIYNVIESELIKFQRNFTSRSWDQVSIINNTRISNRPENQDLQLIRTYYNEWNNKQEYIKLNHKKYKIKLNNSTISISMENKEIRIQKINVFSCIDISNIETCIPISKIAFNQAAQKLEQKFCLDFTWSTCNEWEQ